MVILLGHSEGSDDGRGRSDEEMMMEIRIPRRLRNQVDAVIVGREA